MSSRLKTVPRRPLDAKRSNIYEGGMNVGNNRNNGSKVAVTLKRLNLKLPLPVFNELDELAKDTGRTMTDVIRLGLSLAALAIDEKKAGHKLVITDANGTTLKEIILAK
jgi:predicted DNA-binding protein